MKSRIIYVLLTAVVSGCAGPEPEARSAIFDPASGEVSLPPVNAPLSVSAGTEARPAPAPVRRALLQGTFPDLLVVQGDRYPSRDFRASGEILLSDERFILEPPEQPDITVVFRPPPGMPKILSLPANGTLDVSDRSDPGGMYRQMVLLDPDGLPALAEVSKSSWQPLDVDLGGGLRLVMKPPAVPPATEFEPVDLIVTRGSVQLETAPQGETTTVRTGDRAWLIHPYVSLRQTIGENIEGAGTHYILRVWVAAEYATKSAQGLPPRFRKQ